MSLQWKSMGTLTVWLPIFFKTISVSKWWQNFHFWVDCPFKYSLTGKTWKKKNVKTPKNFIQARWTGSQSTLHLNSLHFPVLTYLLTFQAISKQDICIYEQRETHLQTQSICSSSTIETIETLTPASPLSLCLFYWHWGIWGHFRQIRGNSPKREEALQHSISHLIEWRADINTGKSQQDTQQENRQGER